MYIFPYLLRVFERFVQCVGQKVMWLSIWVQCCHSVRMANSLIEGQDQIGSDYRTLPLHTPLSIPHCLSPNSTPDLGPVLCCVVRTHYAIYVT